MAWGLEQDPLNLMYRHHLAVGLRHAGRPEDAEAELRKVLEIDENFPSSGSWGRSFDKVPGGPP